jgi:hypothetical protein
VIAAAPARYKASARRQWRKSRTATARSIKDAPRRSDRAPGRMPGSGSRPHRCAGGRAAPGRRGGAVPGGRAAAGGRAAPGGRRGAAAGGRAAADRVAGPGRGGGRCRSRTWCGPLVGAVDRRPLPGARAGLGALPLPTVTATALWHARARLGARPLRALFDLLRGLPAFSWSQGVAEARSQAVGRKVLGRALARSRRAAKKFSEEPLYSEGGPRSL